MGNDLFFYKGIYSCHWASTASPLHTMLHPRFHTRRHDNARQDPATCQRGGELVLTRVHLSAVTFCRETDPSLPLVAHHYTPHYTAGCMLWGVCPLPSHPLSSLPKPWGGNEAGAIFNSALGSFFSKWCGVTSCVCVSGDPLLVTVGHHSHTSVATLPCKYLQCVCVCVCAEILSLLKRWVLLLLSPLQSSSHNSL